MVETDKNAWPDIMYNQGGRTLYDYISAVSTGWIHEDLIKQWIEKVLHAYCAKVSLNAHDNERVFKFTKKGRQIVGTPDLHVEGVKNEVHFEFQIEVQHVTNNSRKKTKNLIQVPSHRVAASKRAGSLYLLVVPYVDKKGEATSVAILPAPLEVVGENYVAGSFLSLAPAETNLKDWVDRTF